MSTKKIQIRSTRLFTEEFKKERIKEYETGQFSVLELSKLFHIERTIIYRWIHKYSSYNKRRIKVVEMADSSKKKVKDLQKRIEELERIVGQKQLNIDFLEKMIEITKEQYGIDIKKKSDILPSSGSEKTSKD
jgi:transposase-like protein